VCTLFFKSLQCYSRKEDFCYVKNEEKLVTDFTITLQERATKAL